MKKRNKKEVEIIKNLFLENFQNTKTELKFKNNYELIVCVMLSAQCTDARVNIITPNLFKKYPTIKDMANAKIDDIKKLINTCSFFNNKATNLQKMAQSVVDNFGGEIPLEKEALTSLAGVGGKTANVVLIESLGANFMAVDTHVFRTSHRLRLAFSPTPEATENELSAVFKTELAKLHQAMVLFGRYICRAKSPKCRECFLRNLCDSEAKIAEII